MCLAQTNYFIVYGNSTLCVSATRLYLCLPRTNSFTASGKSGSRMILSRRHHIVKHVGDAFLLVRCRATVAPFSRHEIQSKPSLLLPARSPPSFLSQQRPSHNRNLSSARHHPLSIYCLLKTHGLQLPYECV